jgi:hypothetical protein
VRDASGTLLHDGTLADPARAARGGAAAVVIAPGAALVRATGTCSAAIARRGMRCPRPLPDRSAVARRALRSRATTSTRAPFEDNADFHDRSDAPARRERRRFHPGSGGRRGRAR